MAIPGESNESLDRASVVAHLCDQKIVNEIDLACNNGDKMFRPSNPMEHMPWQ